MYKNLPEWCTNRYKIFKEIIYIMIFKRNEINLCYLFSISIVVFIKILIHHKHSSIFITWLNFNIFISISWLLLISRLNDNINTILVYLVIDVYYQELNID